MAARIAAHDEAMTPLGARERWPATLRAMVDAMLAMPQPAYVAWGPQLACLYNDACIPLLGDRHPAALGRPLADVWTDGGPVRQAALDATLAGQAQFFVDGSMWPGNPERSTPRLAVSWTPLRDDAGEVAGLLAVGNGRAGEPAADPSRHVEAAGADYRALFKSLGAACAILEAMRDAGGEPVDYRVLDINAAYERMTGFPASRALGTAISELIGEEYLAWMGLLNEVVRTGATRRVERHSNQLGAWFDLTVCHAQGDRIAILFDDVSERVRDEMRLRANEERQAYLLALADALQPLGDPVAIQATATRVLGQALGAQRAFYLRHAAEGDAAGYVCDRDYTAPGVASVAGHYSVDDVRDALFDLQGPQDAVIVYDTEGEPALAPGLLALARAFGTRAYVVVPLVKEGRVDALLGVHYPHPHAWTPAEIALVQETAERTWAAVQRARAEAALARSEKRLSAIFEAAPVGLSELDASGRFVSANDALCRILGRPREQVIGMHVGALTHPDDLDAAIESVALARDAGGVIRIEKRHTRLDGTSVWASSTATPLRGRDGLPDSYLVVTVDLTARKDAEERLARTEERLRVALDAARTGTWRYHIETDENALDASMARLLDLPDGTEAITLDELFVRVHPDDRDELVARLHQALADGPEFAKDFRIARPDGSIRWLRIRGEVLRDARGKAMVLTGATVDITEQKSFEAEREESELLLRQFSEASLDVLWIRDARNLRWEYLSPAYGTLYGEPPDVAIADGDIGHWVEYILEEDRDHAIECMEQVRAGAPQTYEFRIRRPNGEVRWVRETDFPLFNAEGRVHRVGGIGHDITELKRTGAALAEFERRQRMLMEGIPQLVWRSLDEGDWTWSSPQWQHFTGQSAEQSLHLGWLDAVHPDDHAHAQEAWAHAAALGILDVEFRVRRARDGAWLWHHTRSLPQHEPGAAAVEWFGTCTDVQALKELQEQQHVLVAELQHRTRNLIGVVRSIAERIAGSSGSLDEFKQRFRDRMAALARVQGLLSHRESGQRVTFDQLLQVELAGLGVLDRVGRDGQIDLDGPDGVGLRSSTVQTFALGLHELMTNAVKYGALSRPEGRLCVHWCVDEDDPRGPRLRLEWRETGVPVPPETFAAGARRGYGRELIERALPYQLQAETSYELRPEGVRCTIRVPLTRPASTTPA